MENLQGIALDARTREERLPGWSEDFPYIATRAELDKYAEPFVPWHWHRPVELFYMERGALEYETPGGVRVFRAGSGGMVNANVLHKSRPLPEAGACVQLLHIFDPALLAGVPGGRVERRYFAPILDNPALELLPLRPEIPGEAAALRRVRDAFCLAETETGYELALQAALLEVWRDLYRLFGRCPRPDGPRANIAAAKTMMLYAQAHYAEPVTVRALAGAAYLSERGCYRVFRDCLHTTPTEYLIRYRLERACRLLRQTNESVTEIALACGFGSGGYFARAFARRLGCTPGQYRRNWQDRS